MSAQIATTILAQLGGGNRLKMMIGAKDFTALEVDGKPALSFKFKMSKKYNYIVIALNAMDLYDITFKKMKSPMQILKEDVYQPFTREDTQSDIYAEDMRSTIEQATGLYLSL